MTRSRNIATAHILGIVYALGAVHILGKVYALGTVPTLGTVTSYLPSASPRLLTEMLL